MWRTEDWGYDEEELVEAMSGDYADDCTEFSEKIFAGAASVNDRTLGGKDWTTQRKQILKNFDCGHVPLNVGPGSAYHTQKPKVLSCLKNSCQDVVDSHDGCLKDLHSRIDKSTRKSNGEKATRSYGENWSQEINSRTLGIE